MNKMDLVPPDQRARRCARGGGAGAIAVSARDRHTTGPLLAAVELALWREGRLEPGSPLRSSTSVGVWHEEPTPAPSP